MSEFRPITSLADLLRQDRPDMDAGYRAGLVNAREPGSDRSRSYWHGWRQGRVAGGHAEPDAAQIVLGRASLEWLEMH